MLTTDGTPPRNLRVDGLLNARDLGGLLRRDGTYTPRGVFYRSENLDKVTTTGWEQVRREGIRTVVDLRQPGERRGCSSPRPDWLATVEVDLDGLENRNFWKDYWDNGLASTALYYLPHLTAMPERAVSALAAIVGAPQGGVLFHCAGGRDRTGLVAMLLLSAIGTQPDEIVADYTGTVRLGELGSGKTAGDNTEPEREALTGPH